MDSLHDLHFAAALAVVKAQTVCAYQTHDDANRQVIETLQEEVERLRQENVRLKQQMEKMEQAASANMNLDLPDSITINMNDSVMVNTLKQVDIIRSYIERCRDRAFDSGTVFIDITCDVLAALADPSLHQNKDDVTYAADWIAEGLDITFNQNPDPPEKCIARISTALLHMMSTFRKFDCFSEVFVTRAYPWNQDNSNAFFDAREQVMHFLVDLGKREGLREFLLSGLFSELLVMVTEAAQVLESEDYIRYSQNASYVCRAIELIMKIQMNRPSINEGDEGMPGSEHLQKSAGLRKWMTIWPEILSASVAICDKLPLITSFVWQLAGCIEGGCGTAWRVGLGELKKSLAYR